MTNHFDFNRLKLSEGFSILNTEPKVMFDEMTKMASLICNMPCALISLTHDKAPHLASNYGIVSQHMPFVNYMSNIAVSEGNDYFYVANMHEDTRLKDDSLVKSLPKITSFNAVLIKEKNEVPIGILCLISNKQKKLTSKQREFLTLVSKQLVRLMEIQRIDEFMTEYQVKVQSYTNRIEEFASMAAHDLKSPIRNLKAFLELLNMKHDSFWDAEDLEYFHFIETSIQKMNALINGLFEYAKADIGELKTSLIPMEEKIKDIFESQIQLCQVPNAELTLKGIQPMASIPIVIDVVFENLINNALKYQEVTNNARIEITQEESQKEYTFYICDNGIGIDPKFNNLIFEPFKRLHNDRIYKGSGLGLATCNRMLKNIGGSISVTPNTPSGSCFTIKIPKQNEVYNSSY